MNTGFINYVTRCLSLLSATLVISLFTITNAAAQESETEQFIAKLKIHYQHADDIKAFSLTHRYLGRSDAYQSWDHQAPSRYQAFKVTDIDLVKQHYAQSVLHHFTGGRLLDEMHFQNDTESLRYEKNGLSLGKQIKKQNMNSFTRYTNLTLMNVDFFAVKPLLTEKNINQNIQLQYNEQQQSVTVIQNNADNKTFEYEFALSPLRLLSIHNKSRKRIYIYDDYQTTNGITYARSLVKYYNGDTVPSFITRLERFDVIDEIEPSKLKVPAGYGPVIAKQDKTLLIKEISPALYLLTNAAASRNILFKVNGDDIVLFGASGSRKFTEKSIDFIQSKFVGKKIRSVYITHAHRNQIKGLMAYVEHDIAIHADVHTLSAIKQYPAYKNVLKKFSFQAISHQQALNGVTFYVLENAHAKRQSFAHFQDVGVIYQADFLEIPADNTVAKILPSYAKTFINFITEKNLHYTRIVAQRNNHNISPQLVKLAQRSYSM